MEETIQTTQEVMPGAVTSRKTRKAAKPSQTAAPAAPADMTIFEQLFYIQQRLKVGKTERNEAEGFPYRSEEAILAALTPLLGDVHCILYFKDEIVDVCPNYIYLKTTAVLANSSGEVVEIPGFAREDVLLPGRSQSQITGAASTYAHKYALKAMFGLAGENVRPERDPDAEASVPDTVRETVAEKPSEPEAPAPSGLVPEKELPLITPSSSKWNRTVMTVAKQRGTHTRAEYAQWLRKTYTISEEDLDILLRMAGKAS